MNEIPNHSINSHTNRFPDFSQQGYLVEQELGFNLNGGRVTYKAVCLQTQQKVVIKQFQFAKVGSKLVGI